MPFKALNEKLSLIILAAGYLCHSASPQNIETPALSELQNVKQGFGLSSIELSYSRPGRNGRPIFGGLVPYGKVWRTGANHATTLTFGDAVTIDGTNIPAGKYGLLSIPGPDEWTLILTRYLNIAFPEDYKSDQDVLRVKIHSQRLPFPVETLTILFANVTSHTCTLQLIWESTFLEVPISTDIDSRIMAQIDNAMNKDNHPYYTAAAYYLDNGKDLNKALEWFDKALEEDPRAFFVAYDKARCQAKLGQKQEAIITAQKAISLAKEGHDAEYVARGEKLLASFR